MAAKREEVDVVVVGAGLSGLSAARRIKLRCPELKVVVLEASDHVGGRTRTIPIKGPKGQEDTLDMGGAWVCDSQPDIMALLKEFNLGHYPQNVKGKKVLEVGDNKIRSYSSEIPDLKWLALVQFQLLINKVESICKEVDIRDPYASPLAHELDSTTIASFIRQNCSYDSVYDIFNSAIQAVLGCDATQVSALFFLAYANASGGVMKLMLVENGSAQEYRVKGGTQQISQNLAKSLGENNIRLNSPVKSIEEMGEKVVVKCKDNKEYITKHVISAIPTNQLVKIDITPAFPSARKSLLKQFYLGNLTKVFVVYSESFWLEDGFSGEVVSTGGNSSQMGCENGPATVWYDATTYKGTPAIVGLYGGKNVDQWFSTSFEVRKAAVIKQLVAYYGVKASTPLDYYEKNWNEEEYVGGAPAVFCPPGSMTNFHLLRQPHGRVHFAGTEVATRWCGYMSGAVQSGHHAAAEVLSSLEPTRLEKEDKELLEDYKPKIRTDYRLVQRKRLSSGYYWKALTFVAAGLALMALFKADWLCGFFH